MIDLSVPISPEMPTWPGDSPMSITPESRLARGDDANVSRYCLSSHTGTHVDPPVHFVDGGRGVDEIPLDVLIGPAVVACLEGVTDAITAADLDGAGVPAGTRRLLLKTRNSRLWDDPTRPFTSAYVSLAADAARWVVERGLRLVGVDYLSVDGFEAPGYPVHRLLLSNGVVILEGLDLRRAEAREYRLVCLPLRVAGGDGGPARAVLL